MENNGEAIPFSKSDQLVELIRLEQLPEPTDRMTKLRYWLYDELNQEEYLRIIRNVKFLSCGRSHTFIITNDNRLYCGGYNAYSQVIIFNEFTQFDDCGLGINTVWNSNTPFQSFI